MRWMIFCPRKICRFRNSCYLCNALQIETVAASPKPSAFFMTVGLAYNIGSVPCGALMRPLPVSRCSATGSGTFFLSVSEIIILFSLKHYKMKTTNSIALQQGASARILRGAVFTTIIPAIRVISVVASATLAPVAYLQCASGNPSLPVILGAATAIFAGAFLPSSTSSRKGGEL